MTANIQNRHAQSSWPKWTSNLNFFDGYSMKTSKFTHSLKFYLHIYGTTLPNINLYTEQDSLTKYVCFTKMGKALKTKSLNYRIFVLNASLMVKERARKLRSTCMCKAWRKQYLKIPTETDRIRSTPLSGFLLHTSRMETAILVEIVLSDVTWVNPFGSNTP